MYTIPRIALAMFFMAFVRGGALIVGLDLSFITCKRFARVASNQRFAIFGPPKCDSQKKGLTLKRFATKTSISLCPPQPRRTKKKIRNRQLMPKRGTHSLTCPDPLESVWHHISVQQLTEREGPKNISKFVPSFPREFSIPNTPKDRPNPSAQHKHTAENNGSIF